MKLADAYDPVRALQASWRLVARAPLPLLAGGVALLLLDGLLHDLWIASFDHRHELRPHALRDLVLAWSCCGCIGFFASCWLVLGLANGVEKTVKSGTALLRDLADARQRYFEMILVRVMVVLLLCAAAIPFALFLVAGSIATEHMDASRQVTGFIVLLAGFLYLPVFLYVALGLSLARLGVAIEGLSPSQAIRRSWALARGARLRLGVYWLALVLFTFVGLCLCCVGLLFTGALAQIAQNESYVALVKSDDYGRSWLAPGATPPPAPPAPATIG